MKEKTFTYEDQLHFAQFSGDYNPLHIDSVLARRYLHGQIVVHGIHLLFWGLNALFETFPERTEVEELEVKFISPVYLDYKIHIEIIHDQDNRYKINLYSGYNIHAKILVKVKPIQDGEHLRIKDQIPTKREPVLLVDNDLHEKRFGHIPLMVDKKYLKNEFPFLYKNADISQLSIILATTKLVGMECPGLNSIYSGLSLKTSETIDYGNELKYEVNHFDGRFGLVVLNIQASNIQGRINAFLRPRPHDQITFQEIKEKYSNKCLVGRHALIIGGSRGIGEISAKYFAAKGARVSITYNAGKDDASRIIKEIKDGSGDANCFHYNVTNPEEISEIFETDEMPDILLYYATPHIGLSEKGHFSLDKFNLFNEFYIDGFLILFEQLKKYVKHIFYPSTIFINTKPKGMWEYLSSKVSGEFICDFIEKEYEDISIFKPRIPKVITDQTVGLLRLKENNTVSVLVELFDEFIDEICDKD